MGQSALGTPLLTAHRWAEGHVYSQHKGGLRAAGPAHSLRVDAAPRGRGSPDPATASAQPLPTRPAMRKNSPSSDELTLWSRFSCEIS